MEKITKKRAAAAVVTLAASAGIVVNGLFDTPGDLLQKENDTSRAAVTQVVGPDRADPEEISGQAEGHALRRALLRLPLAVRALVGVPLWVLGWGLLTLLSALWPLCSPVIGAVLRWLAPAGVLLAVFAAAAKILFPDLPLRRILSKRSVLGILAGACGLGLLRLLLQTYGTGQERLAGPLQLTGAFLIVLAALWLFAVRELRRRAEAERTDAPLSRDEIHRRAVELADRLR